MPTQSDVKVFVRITIVVVIAAAILAAFTTALKLRPVTVQEITALLQTMFVVALFVERAIEVFIAAWRGPDEAAHESAVRSARRTMRVAVARASSDMETAMVAASLAEQARAIFKGETKRIALCAALALGVLISAAGLRSFELFVTLRQSDPTIWERIAHGLFNVLNVLVTGGLIGGGSDLIHQIIKVIDAFFRETAKRITGESNDVPA